MKHPQTPPFPKLLLKITIAYALSPIDLIPDFIPFLGYLDDLIILPLLACLTLESLPEAIIEECREKAETEEFKKTGKWNYAIPVILFWLVLIYVIAASVLH